MTTPNNWMQTYGPGAFVYGDTAATTGITIEAICHALSRIPRFGGHSEQVWTVAHHTIFVHDIAGVIGQYEGHALPASRHFQLYALLHDAHEAFIGDVPAPLKDYMKLRWGFDMHDLEREIDSMIYREFMIPPPLSGTQQIVRRADVFALCLERKLFMPSNLEWHLDSIVLPYYLAGLMPASMTSKMAGKELDRLLTKALKGAR